MEQEPNILEKLQIIKEEFESLKQECNDISSLNQINKIQQNIERLQNMLPKQIYQFTITHYQGYICWINQIEKDAFELKNNLKNNSLKLNYIIGEFDICKTKAEKKFRQKKNKISKKYWQMKNIYVYYDTELNSQM